MKDTNWLLNQFPCFPCASKEEESRRKEEGRRKKKKEKERREEEKVSGKLRLGNYPNLSLFILLFLLV